MAAARCSAPASALPGPRVLIREGTGGGAGRAASRGRGRKGEGRGWRRAAWEAAPGANFQKRARWRHGTRRESRRHAARALPRPRRVARGLCRRRGVLAPAGWGFLGGGRRPWAVPDPARLTLFPSCCLRPPEPVQGWGSGGGWRKRARGKPVGLRRLRGPAPPSLRPSQARPALRTYSCPPQSKAGSVPARSQLRARERRLEGLSLLSGFW